MRIKVNIAVCPEVAEVWLASLASLASLAVRRKLVALYTLA